MAGQTITIGVAADVRKMRAGIDDVNRKLSGMSGAAKKAGGVLKKALAGVAIYKAAKGIAKGFGLAITEASNLEQSIGGVDSVFGPFADSMHDMGKTAAQTVGLTRNEFNELSTSLGASLKNAGIKDFAGETQGVVKLGADLAAQFGGSTKEAVSAIGSLMRGEADPIERYGVGIKQSAVNAELAAKGQDKLTGAARTQAEAQARLSLLMDQTTDAQGAFARESGTWANVVQRGKAALLDLAAKIGAKLLPMLTKLGSYLLDKLPGAVEAVKGAFERVKAALEPVRAALEPVIGFLRDNPETVKAFAIALGVLAGVLAIASAAMAVLNVVMAANPVGLVVIAIAALVAGLVYAYNHSEKFRAVVDKVWAFIKSATAKVFPVVKKIIVEVFGVVSKIVKANVEAVKKIISVVWPWIEKFTVNAFRGVVAGVNLIRNLPTFVRNVGNRIRDFFVSALTSLVSRARSKINSIVSTVRGIKSKITGVISGAGSWLYNAGTRIIQGLLDGINSRIQWVRNKLTDLTNLIPDWKGPAEKDARLLTGAGELIMQSLVDGFEHGKSGVRRALGDVTSMIQGGIDADVTGSLAFKPSAALAGTAGVGGRVYNIHVTAPVGTSGADIGRELAGHIREFERMGGRVSR